MNNSSISEADLVARWCAGLRGPRRTEDGRALRVVFPGVPGPGHGPDIRDAVVDLDGDELRGDVEVHLRARGWEAHGHAVDPAYAAVVLHVVGLNDGGGVATRHASGRVIPVVSIPPLGPPGATAALPAFAPPCATSPVAVGPALTLLARRRLTRKAARARLLFMHGGAGGALFTLLLETLAGSANRATFAEVARRLPLPALLERTAPAAPGDRAASITAALVAAARDLPLVRAGMRPAAHPERRLATAGILVASLWPPEPAVDRWPAVLASPLGLPRALCLPGVSAALAVELTVNAVIPVAEAAACWPAAAPAALLGRLRAPATYGRLRRLEGWLTRDQQPPFDTAAALQGALHLHAEHCARGRCGRCPLSSLE